MTWPLVVGLGSDHGDDQAGWLAIQCLSARGYPESKLLSARHPAELLDHADNDGPLVICDACLGNNSPGTIRSFDWPTDELCYERPSGSHDLSLCDVLAIGRQLDCFPDRVAIWTLEGNVWNYGTEPSADVVFAADRVAGLIWESYHHA